MSSPEASRGYSARSGDSADGTDRAGSGSERTRSDDRHAGGTGRGHADSGTSTEGEHNSSDGERSQHDSEGEEAEAPQESDAEDAASEGGGSVAQESDADDDAASNNSGRGGGGSSEASEQHSDGGIENSDRNSNGSRSDNGGTNRRHPRQSAEQSETEERRERGRSDSSNSGNASASDGDVPKGEQNEAGDGEHSDRAEDSEGQCSHAEEHSRQARSNEKLRDDEQRSDAAAESDDSDDSDLSSRTRGRQPRHKAATKIQATARGRRSRRKHRSRQDDDDDDHHNIGGKGGSDQEEEAAAAAIIQRRVRSRTEGYTKPRYKAATRIQATARGRHSRRKHRSRQEEDDDDNDHDSGGENCSDHEEEAAAAAIIQRRVRSRTTKARADGHMRPRHKAATKIQATARGRRSRRKHRSRQDDDDDDHQDSGGRGGKGGSDHEEEAAAAATIQRRVRSRTEGYTKPRHKAATKIQATARGRHSRRNIRFRQESVSSDGGSSDPGTNANPAIADNGCTGTDGLNLIESEKLLEQHAARRIQRHARRSLLGGEKATRTHTTSEPSIELERQSKDRDSDDELRSRRAPTKPPESDTGGGAKRGSGHRDRQGGARESGASSSKGHMGEDEAARCLQREVRRSSASKKQREERDETHGTHRKGGGLEEDEAVRCIQMELRRGHARRRSPKEYRIDGNTDGTKRSEAGDTDDRLSLKADRAKPGQHHTSSGYGSYPEKAARGVQLELDVEHLGAPQQHHHQQHQHHQHHQQQHHQQQHHQQQQQQQQQHQQQNRQQQPPPGYTSPGKAAAAAASAVAKSAAAAAAAAVRAAEAAADAAEAAEAAAEAEEEWSPSVIINSPPVGRESRRKPSPARSAFRLSEGDNEGSRGPQGRRDGSTTQKSRPYGGDSDTIGAAGEGVDGGGRKRSPRHRGHVGAASVRDNRGEAAGSGSGSDDAKLKHAREQAKKHARDRRARAMAKEEDSRRELRAVHAELVKAEELRNKQANAERSALEAKRARVLDDMNRRQQRLQRLQQEEQALLDRGGNSHRRSSSRSSSADAAVVESKPKRSGGGGGGGEGSDLAEKNRNRGEAGTFSLPPIGGGGGEGRQRRRKQPRHVSTFRERILEERRARKEVDALKRRELEEKHTRQTEYAAKIRAQAKRALAGEQRRAQEDADRSSRARRSGHSVDRTPIAIKRPKQEGEWGVYSYPPDRPLDGITTVKGGVDGHACDRRPGMPGRGKNGRVQDRLDSSDRRRRERGRGVGVNHAREAAAAEEEAAAAAGGGSSRGYGSSEDESRRRRTAGFGRGGRVGSDNGGSGPGRVERGYRQPTPPTEQRGTEDRSSYGHARSGDAGGGRKLGVAQSGMRSGGGRGGQGGRGGGGGRGRGGRAPDLQGRPAGSDDIHALYEERLAALERRLVRAASGGRSFPEGGSVGSDSSVGIERMGAGEGARVRKSPMPPLRGGAEWGTENSPFDYRESQSEYGRVNARMPHYGGGRESTGNREADVEGLSTMYMGPISHKMAKLRGTNS